MFDIAWSKLMIIGVVALIVIGPKDLPGVLRTLGEMIGKLRRMADEFRGQFNDAMRETQFEDIKKDMSDLGDSVRSATATNFNPIQTIRDEVNGAVGARSAGQVEAGTVADSADIAAKTAEAKLKDAKIAQAFSVLPVPDVPAPLSAADTTPPSIAPPSVAPPSVAPPSVAPAPVAETKPAPRKRAAKSTSADSGNDKA